MDYSPPKRDGHSLGAPSLNSAGFVYTIFVTVYTGLLIYGLGLLWLHRRKTAIRIRGLTVTAAAVLLIHVYVAAVFIVYPLNGWYRCNTEFWYMSIVFPLAIAVFQASNVRLMAYSKVQHSLIDMQCWAEKKQSFSFSVTGIKKSFTQLDYVKKTYVCIVLGLLLQVIVTFILYYGSRRFNPINGFFGDNVDAVTCRRGAEWIPSVVWQFAWAWLIGPWILFNTRHIKDTHYWAWQTRLSIIAGLPGTPMWLAFLYSNNPALTNFNKWWPPAMWFAPGLMMMQITSILAPLYDVYRHREIRRPDSTASNFSTAATLRAYASSEPNRSKGLAKSYDAFEFQLRHNIEPLLLWAANRDFTVENIKFLQEVRNFKRKWRTRVACSPVVGLILSQVDQRQMFEDAGKIYFELICPGTSLMPINVCSKTYYDLEQMFRGLRYERPVEFEHAHTEVPKKQAKSIGFKCPLQKKSAVENVVAPWTSPILSAHSHHHSISPADTASETVLIDIDLEPMDNNTSLVLPSPVVPVAKPTISARHHDAHVMSHTQPHFAPAAKNKGVITSTATPTSIFYNANAVPHAFGLKIFDKAEESVKYLVYTNTWKNFVAGVDSESIASCTTSRDGGSRALATGLENAGFEGVFGGVGDAEMKQGQAGYPRGHEFGDWNQYDDDYYEDDGHDHTNAAHHGVLDFEGGPVDFEKVDGRCAACRRKERQGAERILRGGDRSVHD